jgi:hypothetical protein
MRMVVYLVGILKTCLSSSPLRSTLEKAGSMHPVAVLQILQVVCEHYLLDNAFICYHHVHRNMLEGLGSDKAAKPLG